MSLIEPTRGPVTILVVDDDQDDRELVSDALHAGGWTDNVDTAVDGQDLLDYLRHEGRWTNRGAEAPRPAIILLDLNMPRKDGREALAEIKLDASLRHIPVVVLTTSKDDADITSAYDLGATSYISKPATFADWTDVMRTWNRYWFDVVKLPNKT